MTTKITNPSTPTGIAYIKNGTYVGNQNADRAIAHGRTTAPALVIITSVDEGVGPGCAYIITGSTYMIEVVNAVARACPAPDATNFYTATTGAYGNTNLKNYRWVALWT